DEAHDLVDRVTSATTGELSGPAVDTAARRAGRLTESAAMEGSATAVADRLREAAAALAIDLGDAPAGRLDELSGTLAATLTSVQDAAGACLEAIQASAATEDENPQKMAAARVTLASLDDLQRTASRILDAFGEQITERAEVVWLDRPFGEDTRRPPTLRVAPLEVGRVLRNRLFAQRTVALTSATLALGGSFAPLAIQWGLPPQGGWPSSDGSEEPMTWQGLDVGSPFDHPRSGILYVARHLPPPGRDQLPEAYLTELEELIAAAGQAGGRGATRADQPAAALPGRRPHRPAGQAVRRGRADLLVRHAVAVAGRRRPGQLAAAGRHRPDPVPAARRPARLGPAARSGRPRRQRVHDRGGVARRPAAGPGRGPAAADDDRPRGGGGPRPAARDRA